MQTRKTFKKFILVTEFYEKIKKSKKLIELILQKL